MPVLWLAVLTVSVVAYPGPTPQRVPIGNGRPGQPVACRSTICCSRVLPLLVLEMPSLLLGDAVQRHEGACSGGSQRYEKVSGSPLSLDLRSVRTVLGLFDVQRLKA